MPKGVLNKLKEDCIMSKKIQNPAAEAGRYLYEAVRHTAISEEIGDYVTYGIRVSEGGRELSFTADVSTDRETVERLAANCTDGQLDPIHLGDVIEDLLAEVAMM